MELLTLDSNFHPVKLIEKYESLVWTERYSSSGDFILTTPNIEETLNLLPLESTVAIRESTVPMVVEVHKLTKPLRGVPMLEVRGRSCETWLERRSSAIVALDDSYVEIIAQHIAAVSPSDAAYKTIRAVIGDIERFQGETSVLSALSPAASALDEIPQINQPLPADFQKGGDAWVAGPVVYSPGNVVVHNGHLWIFGLDWAMGDEPGVHGWVDLGLWTNYEIPRGNLYSVVLELINQNHHGIKAVRPLTDADTKIDLEIYNGADLTETVVFDARFDQFDDATYLLSHQGSANIAYIYGPNGSQSVRKNYLADPLPPEVSGLDRRVILVDESSDSALNSVDNRTSRAIIELYKYNSTALFDGQTSEQVASGFNDTYFLGDILKLVGEYGLSENVRVAEFIRSEERSGQKAYPAFEVVE